LKIDRHGKAKILTPEEIRMLFSPEVTNARDRALYAVMLYTACRVNEAITLLKRDVYDRQGRVRPKITFRKGKTKGKLATREIPVIEDLRIRLEEYKSLPGNPWLFPGNENGTRADNYLHRDSALWLLRKACLRIGIEGVSTHSFRRTALTKMSSAGIPLRIIQEISGHRTLDELYKYLEVTEEQVLGAVSALSMLTPAEVSSEKPMFIEHFDHSSLTKL
jgi:integrase/recombinase XerD